MFKSKNSRKKKESLILIIHLIIVALINGNQEKSTNFK